MRLTTKCSFVFFCALFIIIHNTDKTLASGPPTCNFGCKGSGGSLLKLDPGATYVYELDGNTETLVPKSKGPFGESVRVSIKATVEVSALPECQTVVHLKDVQVFGPDTKKYGNLGKLSEFPLVVNLHNGKLEPEVCAHPHDDYTSLNIKRAVASLLQANTGDHGGIADEVDVFGGCRTSFRVSHENEFTVIKKSRDLNDCKHREGLRQDFFSSSHGHTSNFQSSPLLGSDYLVEQRVKNGILEVAIAKERYLFRPFANRDNGAKTKVLTKLTLKSVANLPPPAFTNSQPRSIIFENPHEVVTSNAQAVLAALHRLDDTLHGSVPVTAGKDFGILVKLVRHTSQEDLLNIYGNAKAGAGFKNKDVVRKIFTDALFRARSAESVAVAVELLRNHEIQGKQAKLWYLSFAFVRHTSATSLAAVTNLLDEPNLPFEAFYGIGAMAGQYCREHVCEKVPEFEKLLSKFAKIIANPSKVNKERENQIIAALKGLKNVKHLSDEAANKVANAIRDVHAPTRVRVAALETAQTDACRGKLQKASNEIFTNREEDSELRIKAYLVMVECPTSKTAAKLSEFMETEPVNQVGTFVTSHLRNLRAGSNPDKEAAREILYNVKPQKKFPIDYRKFSHNYDFSYNLDAISTSAAVESNVIFSQKSYIPRSVSLNLTTEVFGHAFNIFEINGRAQNLERILEKYFGPKGYFKSHKPEELYYEGKHQVETLMNHIQDKYKSMIRHRRSVGRDQIDHFARKVKLFHSELDNTLDVDLSLKVLGNELMWLNFDEKDEPKTASSIIDRITEFYDREVKNVKEFHHDIKEHFQILDSELSYPTSVGLPLRLKAVGSGVFHMKLGGKFDLAGFLKDPRNSDAHLEIIPSASVDIHGEMTVDAYAIECGVKVLANLHTATGSDISLKMLDGHGFDLNVKLPVKNSDVLTASSEVVTTIKERGQAEVDHLLEFQVPRSDYSGCFDQLDQFIGGIFCGDIGFPMDKEPLISNAALYPLNGHSKVSLRFVKADESLHSYQLRVYFNVDDPHTKTLEVKFDTPGSQTPREISLKASAVTHPQKAVNVELISPAYTFALRGQITENDHEHTISGSFNMNNQMEYSAKVGLLIDGPVYKPVFDYTRVGNNPINVHVDGTVNVDKRPGSAYRKYTFNNVRFTIENKGSITIDGSVVGDSDLIGSDLRVGYDAHSVGIKTKFQRLAPGTYKINAEVNPSQYPNMAFLVKYDLKKDDHSLENHLVFGHGPHLNAPEHQLTASQALHFRLESINNFDISTKNGISYPPMNLEGHLEGAVTRKSVSYQFLLGYEKYKFKSKLNAKTAIAHVGDYDVEFSAGAFDQDIALHAKRDIVDTNKSKFYNRLVVSPGKQYEVTADVLHQLNPNNVHVTIDGVARLHNLPNEYRLNLGVISNPSLFRGHTIITVGPDEIINGELHFTKTADPSGNFKLMLFKVLNSQGEYQLTQGKGTGSFSVHIPELHRKIKGTADLSHSGSHHAGVIDIFYDFERDNNKKLHIQTDTHCTTNEINSKNNVQLDDKHLQINFHGKAHGKVTNGAVSGGYEVTLPDGEHFVGTLKESLQVLPQATQAEFFVEMGRSEKAGGPLSKLFVNTYARNVDLRGYSGELKFEAGKECPEGNMLYVSNLNSVPHDGKLMINHDSSITGSAVKHPFNAKTHAVVSRHEVSYDGSASFGDYSLKTNAKMLTGVEDGIRHLEYLTDVRSNSDPSQNLNLQHLFHYAPGHGDRPHSLQVSQKVNVNGKPYELEAHADGNTKHGIVKGHLLLPTFAKPSSAQLEYRHDIADGKYKSDVTFSGDFDQGKVASLKLVSEYDKNLDFIITHLTGHLPVESLNTIDLRMDHKKLGPMSRHTDISFVVNGEKIDGFIKYDFTPQHPLIDFSFNQAAGKSRFFYKLDKISERQSSSEGLILWTRNGGGQLDFSSKIDLQSFENFHVLIKVNSEKLKIHNMKWEIVNKPSKSGAAKKINLVAQSGDKVIFGGSVSYKVKENERGFSVEGKGNVEYDNEKHPLNYKATFKRLSSEEDHEVGTSFNLDANFNKGSIVLDHKISNKVFLYNSKFCKQSACAHFEAISKLELSDALELNQISSIFYENTIDGRNDHYKLYSQAKRHGLIFDHEAGLINKDRKYLIKSHVHENDGGIVIAIPSREIALIANYEIPIFSKPSAERMNGLFFRFDGSLYLDRLRKPNEKANLLMLGEFTTAHRSISANGEVKFTHPRLHKDLVISTKSFLGLEKRLVDASIDVDVFNKKNQKISASVILEHDKNNNGHNITGNMQFSSRGLHLELGGSGHAYGSPHGFSAASFLYYTDRQNVRKEAGAFIEGDRSRLFGIVKVPSRELLKLDSKYQIDKNHQSADCELTVAERISYVGGVNIDGWRSFRSWAHPKDNPGNKVECNVEIQPSHFVAQADHYDGSQKNDLFMVNLKLTESDPNHPGFSYNSQHIQNLLHKVKEQKDHIISTIQPFVREVAQEVTKDLRDSLEGLKRAQPDYKPLFEAYQTEIQAITNELQDDPEFRAFSEVVQKFIRGMMKLIEQYSEKLIVIQEKISQQFHELQEKAVQMYEKLLPTVTEAFEKIVESWLQIANELLNYSYKVLSYVLQLMKEAEPEIRKIAENFGIHFKDLFRAIADLYNTVKHEAEEWLNRAIQEVKQMHIFSTIEEHWEELVNFEIPQQFWTFYGELVFAIEDILPTVELKELARSFFAYIENKLKKQSVNDAVVIRDIIDKATAAVRSVVSDFKEQYFAAKPGFLGLNVPLTWPSLVLKLPQIGSLKDCSLMRQLKALSELPSLLDIIYTYRPTINPLDYIPPYNAYGTILRSHHFFTFDKRHVAFEGSCSYILAQDFLDGNFSIVANLENGHLKSLTIADRMDTIELFSDNTVSVNGKHGDLPFKTTEMSGWLRYGAVNINHKAGVKIRKIIKQDLISIKVSGFYFWRTRGILGTISNEKYDEFLLPNGHIAADANEFVNAYKVDDSCPAAHVMQGPPGASPECEKFFGSGSTLKTGFNFVCPKVYKEACEQHVAMSRDKHQAACDVVTTYVLALKKADYFLASLPSECAQCSIANNPVEYGHSVPITSPAGKADVIFVVEQSSFNGQIFNELVKPLMGSLTNSLGAKGLGDVEFAVIGYGGPKQDWPKLYGNNGKITFSGNSENIVFGDSEKLTPPYDTFEKKVKYILHFFSIELGKEQIVTAMTEANIYPFRQGAAKVIILVNTSPCEKSPTYPISLQLPRTLTITNFYKSHGLNFHIISPLPTLTVSNTPNDRMKNIVGFDNEHVYTIDGAKLNRKDLVHFNDLCISFSQSYGGAAFSSQNFAESGPEEKRRFVDIVSHRVADGASAYEYAEECTCNLYHGVFAYPECKVTNKMRKP